LQRPQIQFDLKLHRAARYDHAADSDHLAFCTHVLSGLVGVLADARAIPDGHVPLADIPHGSACQVLRHGSERRDRLIHVSTREEQDGRLFRRFEKHFRPRSYLTLAKSTDRQKAGKV
jgi:hypothetical protein